MRRAIVAGSAFGFEIQLGALRQDNFSQVARYFGKYTGMARNKNAAHVDTIESLKKEAEQLRKKLQEDRKNLNDAECKYSIYFKFILSFNHECMTPPFDLQLV